MLIYHYCNCQFIKYLICGQWPSTVFLVQQLAQTVTQTCQESDRNYLLTHRLQTIHEALPACRSRLVQNRMPHNPNSAEFYRQKT